MIFIFQVRTRQDDYKNGPIINQKLKGGLQSWVKLAIAVSAKSNTELLFSLKSA